MQQFFADDWDLQSRRAALTVEPSALFATEGRKTCSPFQAASWEGTLSHSLCQLELRPISPVHPPLGNQRCHRIQRQKAKRHGCQPTPRYPGSIVLTLKPKPMWKLSSKKMTLSFLTHESSIKCYREITFLVLRSLLIFEVCCISRRFRERLVPSNTCLLFPNILVGLMKDITSANSISVLRRDTVLETNTMPTGHA